MTVHELLELLRDVPEDAEVVAEYDCGTAQGEIMGTRTEGGGIVLIIDDPARRESYRRKGMDNAFRLR